MTEDEMAVAIKINPLGPSSYLTDGFRVLFLSH